jgi:superfamily I DNA/RNA helicase
MGSVDVLLGPPGTGKTTTLLTRVEALLKSGVPSEEIAFVSFTKAACAEARERAAARFCLDEEQLPWFRTIHSAATAMIGGMRALGEAMEDRHWKGFAESCKYEFSGGTSQDVPFFPAFETDGDQIRQVHELSRIRLCSIEKAMLRVKRRGLRVSAEDIRTFAARLAWFKREHRLIDFTDQLERALVAPRKPPVSYAFVDEAQDLSPLQNRLVDHWFVNSRCGRVTFAGDDDQAIFNWAGADPDHLIAASRANPTEVLRQSYRIPASVHRIATSIVSCNRNRVEKVYAPRTEEGRVVVVSDEVDALAELDGPAMVLVRNKVFANKLYAQAMAGALLFSSELGVSAPLDRVASRAAYRAIASLRKGGSATASDFARLIEKVPVKVGSTEILPRGAKAAIAANQQLVSIQRARDEFRLGTFVDLLTSSPTPCGSVLLSLAAEERAYLDRILAIYGPALPAQPQLTLTTKHRSKGREAHTVIVLADMARASHAELLSGDHEAEHRVAYVAATRAKCELRIVRPQTRRFFPYDKHLGASR